MYTSQCQGLVEIGRMGHSHREQLFRRHGLYVGEQIAFGAISKDYCRDPEEE